MSSSSKGKSGVGSSFDAFTKVDDLVSKPVLGSDGAASWQEFRKDNKCTSHRPSVAPKAPLKKIDRLGAGFTSWEDERSHEDRVRKEAGHVGTGSGYTNFKKKNSAEEAAERKRIKNIEARIRPDDKEYFLSAQTFQGWKFDYIFTTRPDRGTGYFWDGMDSIKKLRGELKEDEADTGKDHEEDDPVEQPEKSKKKKRKKDSGPVIIHDPNNPLEQVAVLIERRKQMMAGLLDPSLPDGWGSAKDAASGKLYYFNRSTGERSWEKPQLELSVSTPDEDAALPDGWTATKDATSGKTYYYHTNGQTSWDKPT